METTDLGFDLFQENPGYGNADGGEMKGRKAIHW